MNLKTRHNTYFIGCECKYHHRTDEVHVFWGLDTGQRKGEVHFFCPTTGDIQAGLIYRGG